MARRSRRKGAKRRSVRRASARRTIHRNPRATKRKASRRRRVMHHNPRRGRRSFRRNPGGLKTRLMDGLKNGLVVTGGVLGQNAIVRYVPNLVPATMTGAATINALLKDVLGIVAGAYGAASLVGADRAKFLVAGQVHAAIARQLRANAVPVVSTLLGEYDPVRLGSYRPSMMAGCGADCARALQAGVGNYATGFHPAGHPTGRIPMPAARASNVRTLANVGVYSDGIAFSPSMF